MKFKVRYISGSNELVDPVTKILFPKDKDVEVDRLTETIKEMLLCGRMLVTEVKKECIIPEKFKEETDIMAKKKKKKPYNN